MKLFKDKLISLSEMDAIEAQYNENLLKYKIANEKLQLLEKGEKPAFARKGCACISLRKGRCIGLKGPPYVFATIPGPVDDLIKPFILG